MTATFEVLAADISGIYTIEGLKAWGQRFRVEILNLPPEDQGVLRLAYRARVKELEERRKNESKEGKHKEKHRKRWN